MTLALSFQLTLSLQGVENCSPWNHIYTTPLCFKVRQAELQKPYYVDVTSPNCGHSCNMCLICTFAVLKYLAKSGTMAKATAHVACAALHFLQSERTNVWCSNQ